MTDTAIEASPEVNVTPVAVVEVKADPSIVTDVPSELAVEVSKQEYTVVGDNLYASVSADDAPPWLLGLIDEVMVSSLGTSLLDVESLKNSVVTAIDEVQIAKNSYAELINIETTIEGIIATRLQQLNGRVNDNEGNITNLNNVSVTESGVTTIVADYVTASTTGGEISSRILQLQQAVVNTSNANAISVEALSSVIGDPITGLGATADVTHNLNTYVGLGSDGLPDGTGLLAGLGAIDGIQDTITGEHVVIVNASSSSQAELVQTAEPYVTWKAADTAAGNDLVRKAKVGDVYVQYTTNSNGTKSYIASYKFLKVAVDSTSPFSTDTEGYTWALIVDQVAQAAYEEALNAYALADGKITTFKQSTPPVAEGEGDLWFDSSNDDLLFVWDGTSWVDSSDKRIVAIAQNVTNLDVSLTGDVNQITNDLGAEVIARVSGDSNLMQTLTADITNGVATVESKFAYDSTIGINGTYYSSSFGLTSLLTGGVGTEADPYDSEFWIDAEKFKFTNSAQTGQVAPFTIDASGTTPQVSFNGVVSFSNLTDVPTLGASAQDVVTAINDGSTTKIDGGSIVTGSLSALSANLGAVTAGVIYDSSWNGTTYKMKIDLDNGGIYIR